MEQKLILIIDDEVKISRMLSRRLRKAGYLIDIADNGETGLEKAQVLKPDLILLDIHMPRMNGFEVIRTLRSNKYDGLVAACSASVTVADSNLTLEAGCNYFISKPIDLEFEHTISKILSS